MAMKWLFFSCLSAFCPSSTAASHSGAIDWEAYERGDLGATPQVNFRTTSFTAPLIHFPTRHEECERDSEYVFFTPRGEHYPGNKAVILDQNGDLIWYQQELGFVNDFRMQIYKSEDYLTYWVGDEDSPGHGRGYYKMLDRSYNLAFTINACNNFSGDYHEFSITSDNTALVTSYTAVPKNLTSYGKPNGFIWDCIFQEIEIETNRLLFEWRATDHFKFGDMAINSWKKWTGTENDPWDWFHLNSVEKDVKGNFLIAARYSNAVSYIDGDTGEVLWNLGGLNNAFIDLTQGNATKFIDPQMARWADPGNTLTLFDNVAHWTRNDPMKQSRGVEIQVNLDTFIAKQIKEFVHPERLFGMSDGSLQTLANGNYFLGYGSMSVYAEFSNNNTLICSAHYSPLNASHQPEAQGSLKSYRTYKYPWRGQPLSEPAVRITPEALYVSWKGATEVQSWTLDGRKGTRWQPGQLSYVGKFQKSGFETVLALESAGFSSFLLTALGRSDGVLGTWIVHEDGIVTKHYQEVSSSLARHLRPSNFLLIVVVAAAIFVYVNRRHLSHFR